MIKEFIQGYHSENLELEEDYLDWFFLYHFKKESGYWKKLSEAKLNVLVTLTQEKEKEYWDTWIKIYKKMWSK